MVCRQLSFAQTLFTHLSDAVCQAESKYKSSNYGKSLFATPFPVGPITVGRERCGPSPKSSQKVHDCNKETEDFWFAASHLKAGLGWQWTVLVVVDYYYRPEIGDRDRGSTSAVS